MEGEGGSRYQVTVEESSVARHLPSKAVDCFSVVMRHPLSPLPPFLWVIK